jgi:hypothetical protein
MQAAGSPARTIHLGLRPAPTPLDPASWAALRDCLDHRAVLGTANPHVLITKQTKSTRQPASAYYLSHVLDPAGVRPRLLRSTRLAELVTTMDPKLVSAAFGMRPEGVLIYRAGHVDAGRLETANPRNLSRHLAHARRNKCAFEGDLLEVKISARPGWPTRSVSSSYRSSAWAAVNSRIAKSSQISRVILASLRIRVSKLRSACPPARWASSLEQVVKVTSWPRRQAWWPSAAARWLLPVPTVIDGT